MGGPEGAEMPLFLPLSQEVISLQPLRILGVKVHPGQRKEQILLDLSIR